MILDFGFWIVRRDYLLIQNRKSKIQNMSGGFDDFAGLEAAGADADALGAA